MQRYSLGGLTFLLVVGLCAIGRTAYGVPVVVLNFTPLSQADVDLSSAFASSATLDWIRWTNDLTPSDFTHKATGGGVISTYTLMGDAPQSATFDSQPSSSSYIFYHWHDGDPLASEDPKTTAGGLLQNTNGYSGPAGSVGTGFTLSATPGAAGSGRLRLYVGVGNGIGSLTATLGSASRTLAEPSQNEAGGSYSPNSGFYDVTFSGMQSSDSLQLNYRVASDFYPSNFQDHAYATLMAAALSYTATPEPASAALLGLALSGLVLRRRAAA